MTEYVYRVDNELLTLTVVDKATLNEDTPMNCWIPVMHGAGEYIYYESKFIAINVLLNIIDEKIDVFKDLKDKIKQELL